MTFNGAIELKNKIGNTIDINGNKHNVMVVPNNIDEANSYLSYCILDPLNDKNAIKYSTNLSFTVFAVCYINSGIVYKKLEDKII